MKTRTLSGLAAGLGLTLGLMMGASLRAQAAVQGLPRFSHPRDITNPYLPLASLKQDILEGKEGAKKLRVERTAKPDIRKTFRVAGQTVETLAVEDREFEDGNLKEATLDYFAQADDGAVYYFGEDVDEYKNGKVVGHEGAWLLGKHTDRPGILFPARPKVGDAFRSEDVPGISTEDDEVVSLSESVKVPAGSFQNCVKVREKLSDGAIEYKYYAPGIGVVKELPEGGELVLVSHATTGQKTTSAKPAASASSQARTGGGVKPPLQDPMARAALTLVGVDPMAEMYWMAAINDPGLPPAERSDLIEDLNEEGFFDPKRPQPEELPLILNRLWLIEELAWSAMDQTNLDAFQEAYKDLVNLAELTQGRGEPVR